ncbi:MAG TPA: hypothetical protein VM536_06135, partial [Chloroflexia bacterium]|nr:hypothetical protein [Chloroflexia bacterium]
LPLTRAAAGRFVVWAGTAIAVFAAFMVPPILANPLAVGYAFLTQEGRRVLNGPGVPVWLDGALAGLLGAESPAYALWHARLLAWSNPLLVAAAVACMAGIIVLAARRARPIGLQDSRLLALVALGGLLQIVLAKWVTGHYYQLPLALVLLWDTVRRAPAFPYLGIIGATLGFRILTTAVTIAGVKEAALLALFAALVAAVLQSSVGPATDSAPTAEAPRHLTAYPGPNTT